MSESFFGAGSLEVSGTFDFTLDDPEAFAGLMGLAEPPRHDMRVDFAEDAGRTCPACLEPATAVVVEGATLVPFKGIGDGDTVTFQVVGVGPAAYRCEPCGHRFGRNGKEIDGG